MTNLIERAKNMIITPKTEWEKVNTEDTQAGDLFMKYMVPLALIGAVAAFIGYGLVGYRIPFIGRVASMKTGVIRAVISLISSLGGVYVTAIIINALAPSFGGTKNMTKALQLVAYSYTAAFVAAVFNILPSLSVLAMLAGLYSLYVLYLGFAPLMKPAADKVTVYFVISIVVLIVVYAAIGAILGAILLSTLI
ncbi:MAG: YIP1 family protein [Bacteroidales bacterium]|nr:YIP1 family protein [Bacteroidales bacterium]